MPPALAGAFPTCAGPSGGGRVCIALRCEARSRRGSFHALAHAVCRCIDYTICMQVLAIAGGPVAFLQKARYRSVLEPGYNYPIARRLRPITKKRTVKMLSRSALRPSPEAAVPLGRESRRFFRIAKINGSIPIRLVPVSGKLSRSRVRPQGDARRDIESRKLYKYIKYKPERDISEN